jgi:L-lactate dehydrogenase complex protein LldG
MKGERDLERILQRSASPATREAFLARVRAAQPPARPLPPPPDFPGPGLDAAQRLERFEQGLAGMGGRTVRYEGERSPTALAAFIRGLFERELPLCAATAEVESARPLSADTPPASLHDVEVAVVRARHGVAETGSVWFSEVEYRVNAIGYLAQHLVVLLDPAAVVEGLQDIYRLPDFGRARYAVLVTGPSATADIEGVLIRGAQGVRSLTVVWLPLPA